MLARASLASSTEVLASALSALWRLRCSLAVDAEREGTIATVHVTVEGGVFVDGGVARAPSREASRAKPAWVWSPDLLWEHATHGISARAVLDEAILGERAACSVARPDIPAFGALKQPLAALLLDRDCMIFDAEPVDDGALLAPCDARTVTLVAANWHLFPEASVVGAYELTTH